MSQEEPETAVDIYFSLAPSQDTDSYPARRLGNAWRTYRRSHFVADMIPYVLSNGMVHMLTLHEELGTLDCLMTEGTMAWEI